MSVFVLRIIACVAMLIDHIGITWGISEFRLIGRIAFPIFAFLLVNGYRHTKNLNKYLLRLGIFALISEIPYDLFLAHKPFNFGSQNIFFTLFLGLVMIALMDMASQKNVLLSLLPLAVFCAAAMLINCDYGYIGILTVAVFHVFYGNDTKSRVLLAVALLFTASWQAISYNIAELVITLTDYNLRDIPLLAPFFFNLPSYKQIYRVFALIPIFMYNGKKGFSPKSKTAAKISQYGFYAFYPLHILIIHIIWRIGG